MTERISRGEKIAAIEVEEGVSLSFVERKLALTSLAEVYGNYAQARGLKAAVKTALGKDELSKRYEDPVKVAAAAMEKAKEGLQTESDRIGDLMKTKELIAAGFDAFGVEDEELRMRHGLRREIGVDVGARARRRFIGGLYAPDEAESPENDGRLF